MTLAQLAADEPYIADGGLETVLIYFDGIDLPEFASFPLLDTDDGTSALRAYYQSYLDIARRHGRGVVLDTPTWRASLDWGARLGYEPDSLRHINERAVRFVRDVASEFPEVSAVVNGAVGPRGDGYVI